MKTGSNPYRRALLFVSGSVGGIVMVWQCKGYVCLLVNRNGFSRDEVRTLLASSCCAVMFAIYATCLFLATDTEIATFIHARGASGGSRRN